MGDIRTELGLDKHFNRIKYREPVSYDSHIVSLLIWLSDRVWIVAIGYCCSFALIAYILIHFIAKYW